MRLPHNFPLHVFLTLYLPMYPNGLDTVVVNSLRGDQVEHSMTTCNLLVKGFEYNYSGSEFSKRRSSRT